MRPALALGEEPRFLPRGRARAEVEEFRLPVGPPVGVRAGPKTQPVPELKAPRFPVQQREAEPRSGQRPEPGG